jgi:hypothetical protein
MLARRGSVTVRGHGVKPQNSAAGTTCIRALDRGRAQDEQTDIARFRETPYPRRCILNWWLDGVRIGNS